MSIIYLAPKDWMQFAPYESEFKLIERYGFGVETIRRLRKETGIKPVGNIKRDPPEGFAEQAKHKSLMQLVRDNNSSKAQVTRWLKEMGVKAQKHRVAQRMKKALPLPKAVDMSRAGRAANHIGKTAPISRCDQYGNFSHVGTHWRYGRHILTAEMVIEKAVERFGWDENAWARLAA